MIVAAWRVAGCALMLVAVTGAALWAWSWRDAAWRGTAPAYRRGW